MRLIPMLLALMLAGCQGGITGKSTARGTADARGPSGDASLDLAKLNKEANTGTNSTNSEVVRLVAAATIGQAGVADDPKFGGRVSIVVVRDFTAASGRLCRRFTVRRLAAAPEEEAHVACQDNEIWFAVEP